MKRKAQTTFYYTPDVGELLTRRTWPTGQAGDCWICTQVYGEFQAQLRRVRDRYTIDASGIRMKEDGTFTWDYTCGGFYPEGGEVDED